jgi:seryl-tRNA synthetase
MLDIKYIRQNPEEVKEGLKKKGAEVDIDALLSADEKRRKIISSLEEMKAEKNAATIEIPQLKDEKKKKEIIEKMKRVDEKADKAEEDLKKITEEFLLLLRQVPNIPLKEVPVGKDETGNVVIKEVGEKPVFSFKPKDYMEIAEKLDIIDTKRAAKASGTRFGYIKGGAALLELGLINLAFDVLKEEGFIPVIPPVMLKPEMMQAMGYLDRGRDEIYYFEKDDLYLVGTSEQSIGAMHADEIFLKSELPKRYAGFSTCFRREAGASGKDTKGILRVHQFDKVEMFSFCDPEKSSEEHKLLLSMEEKLMQILKIPYRVLDICTGDLGDPAAAKYDIEAWLPGQNCYRETHSTSNCTSFQARRLNVRYRDPEAKKIDFVHTLNGTAFATGRIIISIIENYQQEDGSVKVPEALQQYIKIDKIS